MLLQRFKETLNSLELGPERAEETESTAEPVFLKERLKLETPVATLNCPALHGFAPCTTIAAFAIEVKKISDVIAE